MFKHLTCKPMLLATLLLAVSSTSLLYANEDEDFLEEDSQDYSEQTYGDEEAYSPENEEQAFEERPDNTDEQYAEDEEAYVDEEYAEEGLENNEPPVWEGPLPYEPAYSGRENMKIERSTRPKRKNLMAQAEPDGSGIEGEKDILEDEQEQASFFEGECDPVVSISANQEKRFDILKKLADEHGFEIMMLESENQAISLEKHEQLSRVIESITRDMSVVLNYKKTGDCERLTAISVIDNEEWSGGGASRFSGASAGRLAEKVRQYKPKFRPISVSRDNEPGTYNTEAVQNISSEAYEKAQEKQEEIEALREERRKARELRSLNKELPGGRQLNNDFYVKDDWKKQREKIDNMEVYVDEVMTGKRVPNIRGMTIQQRTKYMRLRREYKNQPE